LLRKLGMEAFGLMRVEWWSIYKGGTCWPCLPRWGNYCVQLHYRVLVGTCDIWTQFDRVQSICVQLVPSSSVLCLFVSCSLVLCSFVSCSLVSCSLVSCSFVSVLMLSACSICA
jgi:hypothetical protein